MKDQRMKVVVIDDDPGVLHSLQTVLNHKGCDVLTFHNPSTCPMHYGQGCPCLLSAPCPDMILADYDMPTVNGFQFLERLNHRGCKCRHVAVMTASDISEPDLVRMSKWGVRLIFKPFDLEQLNNWIDQIKREATQSIPEMSLA